MVMETQLVHNFINERKEYPCIVDDLACIGVHSFKWHYGRLYEKPAALPFNVARQRMHPNKGSFIIKLYRFNMRFSMCESEVLFWR